MRIYVCASIAETEKKRKGKYAINLKKYVKNLKWFRFSSIVLIL